MSEVCSANREGNFMQNIPKTVDGVVLDSRYLNPIRLGKTMMMAKRTSGDVGTLQ